MISISIFDYSFSLDDEQIKILGTGKKVIYHSLRDFITKIEGNHQQLLIRQSDLIVDNENKIRAHFLWGEEKILKEYLNELDTEFCNLRKKLSKDHYSVLTNNYQENPKEDYVNLIDYSHNLLK